MSSGLGEGARGAAPSRFLKYNYVGSGLSTVLLLQELRRTFCILICFFVLYFTTIYLGASLLVLNYGY